MRLIVISYVRHRSKLNGATIFLIRSLYGHAHAFIKKDIKRQSLFYDGTRWRLQGQEKKPHGPVRCQIKIIKSRKEKKERKKYDWLRKVGDRALIWIEKKMKQNLGQ